MDPSDARDILTASPDAAGASSGSAIRPRLLQECSVWKLCVPGACIVNCGDCFVGVDGFKAHKGLAAALGFTLCAELREFLRVPCRKCWQRPRGSVARGATRRPWLGTSTWLLIKLSWCAQREQGSRG
uniref:Uncharacterized protein n=1 Tax=Noctiluca scintillans TaxID=2966 RepID=A0A7S0ZMU6_NOCSC|mmetsp:Transcript_11400/g.31838  ORF Transcript_11400/g.31838 Transcript_11400/m.31838 type:complete len:128 (+) Transcript_11400:954-1337(+)